MSEDVPVAQPARRVTVAAPPPRQPGTTAVPAPQTHAWRRYLWIWEVYFAVVAVFTLVAITRDDVSPQARAVASALVSALAVWYALFGRRLMRDPESGWMRRAAYQSGTLVLLLAAVASAGSSGFVMFALVPPIFMMWPLVPAVAILLALLATTAVAAMLRTGQSPRLTDVLPDFGIMVLLAVVLTVYITRIAQQSAERAELVDELAASQAEVSRLSHEAGVAAERQRLAGDIHDTIAQGLSSVVMLVQSAEVALDRDPDAARRHLALARQTARDNLAEARALVAALTPAALDGASLPEALSRLAARAATGTTVTVDGAPRPLPTPVEVVLLRAAQEALTNVDKHAAAVRATVRLAYDQGCVLLEVGDDGCGVQSPQLAGGYGLGAMRARVAQVDGTLTVDGVPGAGTTVRVRVPA